MYCHLHVCLLVLLLIHSAGALTDLLVFIPHINIYSELSLKTNELYIEVYKPANVKGHKLQNYTVLEVFAHN